MCMYVGMFASNCISTIAIKYNQSTHFKERLNKQKQQQRTKTKFE